MTETKKHPAWKMLILSCLLIGAGQGILVNCAGLFIQPVCKSLGFAVGPFSTYLAVGAVSLLVGFPMVGKVLEKVPIKPLMIVCVIVNCGMFMLYSQFTQLWMFYVGGAVVGLASVIPAYMVGPMVVSNWFESKKGMAMGIAMSCVGIFGAIFSIVGGILIEGVGYQPAYLILGGTAMLVMIPAALMVVLHPAMKGLQPYRTKADAAQHAGETPGEITGIPKAKAIKSAPFICMFITMFFMVCGGAFAPQIAGLVATLGYDMAQAGSMTSMFMVGSLLGSFVLGFLNDKLGVRNTMYVTLALGAAAIFMLTIGAPISTVILVGGLLFFGVFASGCGVQPPLIVSTMFGQRDYAAIYAVLQMAMSLAGILATPVFGFVLDATGSFNLGLFGLAALLAVGAVLTTIAFKSYKKLWDKVSVAAV